jgi:hypothetical protein
MKLPNPRTAPLSTPCGWRLSGRLSQQAHTRPEPPAAVKPDMRLGPADGPAPDPQGLRRGTWQNSEGSLAGEWRMNAAYLTNSGSVGYLVRFSKPALGCV